MNKKGFIITGTNTEVGKTFITTSLLSALLNNNYKATAYKPVQSGVDDNNLSDVQRYKSVDSMTNEALYSFKEACSPHLAATKNDAKIDFNKLIKSTNKILSKNDITLIEGAGGIYVPLNANYTFLDYFKQLDLPIILVCENKLGAINNTLISAKTLLLHGLTIAAIVLNDMSDEKDYIKKDNLSYIKKHFPKSLIFDFPKHSGLKNETFFEPFLDNLIEFLKTKEIDYEFDKKHIWHPYTSMKNPLKCFGAVKTDGNYIYLENKKVLDAMSSWWCEIRGYNNEQINEVACSQIHKMAHVMFGGITHNEAIDLTKLILDITPKSLQHVFYADSGSVSVEVALKMAIQYQNANGKTDRKKILTFEGGYHGDTFGAMSVCDPKNGMHTLFTNFLAKQIFLPRPKNRFGKKIDSSEKKNIKEAFRKHHKEIAAFICEPIVQGAGGMWIYDPSYLRVVKKLCKKYDILLICDEIATGFGRTGKMFGVQYADIEPDIMCIGKALSGGYATFAATITNKKVAFGISKNSGVLMHGPTFMANPLMCAIATKNIELLTKSNWQKDVLNIEKILRQELSLCAKFEIVNDIRIIGAIGVIELNKNINVEKIQLYFVKNGIWIRPFGKLLYIMPPFTTSKKELKKICHVVYNSLKNEMYR